jgi:hypothetical protein
MSSAWTPAGPQPARLPSRPDTSGLVGTALLLDVSGSMAIQDGPDELRRVDRLVHVLRDALSKAPGARVVAFGIQVRENLTGLEPGHATDTLARLPEPGGGTPMTEALALVGTWQPRPARIAVISDGLPDDKEGALAAARALKPAVIHALYVGLDGDLRGVGFMRALSLMGGRGGVSGLRTLTAPKELAAEIAGLLAGPSSR